MRVVETDTAIRYQTIYQHQAVLVLTDRPGKTWRGIILRPGRKQSFVRLNQDGQLRECRVHNTKLIPVSLNNKA